MLNEFKAFIAKGNVIDLAVGIIIGTAFTAIVTSLVDDLVNPILGLVVGGIDFSSLKLVVGAGDNAAAFNYGNFINAIIKFLIIAWVVFLLVKAVNKAANLGAKPAEAPAAPAAPTEVELLQQILGELKAK